jgi:signal transduction histidine kinase
MTEIVPPPVPGPRELTALELTPRRAGAITMLSGVSAILVAWLSELGSPLVLLVAALGVAAITAWIVSRTAREAAALVGAVDAVTSRLDAWADGVEPPPTEAHPLACDLAKAGDALIARLERARAEARRHRLAAEQADEERLGFLGDFSHELRTPLNAILGFAHVLESESEGPLDAEGHQAIGIVLASGEQIRVLVEDVLDLTALETGRLKRDDERTDLGEVARQVVAIARHVAEEKGVSIELDDRAAIVTRGSEAAWRRILWNVVTRSVRATDQGAITLSVRSSGDGDVTLELADRGRAWSPLERASLVSGVLDEAASREGAGIGLAVAGKLLASFGATVRVVDHEEGSTVELHVPRGEASA